MFNDAPIIVSTIGIDLKKKTDIVIRVLIMSFLVIITSLITFMILIIII